MSRTKDYLEEQIEQGKVFYDPYTNEYREVEDKDYPKVIYFKDQNSEITGAFVSLYTSETNNKEQDTELLISRGVIDREVSVDEHSLLRVKVVKTPYEWDELDPYNPLNPNFTPYRYSLTLEDSDYNRAIAQSMLNKEGKVFVWKRY